jgi:hypothetical protein
MAVTREQIIFEFVQQAGGSNVCFKSPDGNRWTKVIGPSFGRTDKGKSHICIEYGIDAVTVTEALADKLANTPVPAKPRKPPGHFGRFTWEIELAAVSRTAKDVAQVLITAAKAIKGW